MSELLKIRNLNKSYDGEIYALKNVNLTFKENEFVIIIGPSGSGKSTLIRCINRLVEPTDGSIVFDGKEMTGIGLKELRELRTNIGMIFQDYNLIARSSVLKNVLNGKLGQLNQWDTIFGRYSQEDIQKAVSILEELDLQDHIYKRGDELSGGQQQRVGIARALIQDPKLLLADEPIASLDPASSKNVMDELKSISNRKKLTCIINLHQVNVAIDYATRIIGIRQGEIVFDGKPQSLTDAIVREIYQGRIAEATREEVGECVG